MPGQDSDAAPGAAQQGSYTRTANRGENWGAANSISFGEKGDAAFCTASDDDALAKRKADEVLPPSSPNSPKSAESSSFSPCESPAVDIASLLPYDAKKQPPPPRQREELLQLRLKVARDERKAPETADRVWGRYRRDRYVDAVSEGAGPVEAKPPETNVAPAVEDQGGEVSGGVAQCKASRWKAASALRVDSVVERHQQNLYSFSFRHILEWPSLTVDWMPHKQFTDPERDYNLEYLAVGTQARRGERNYVSVLEVAVPLEIDTGAMYHLFGDERDAEVDDNLERYDIDPGKKFANVRGHCITELSFGVDGAVLKIRAMPQDSTILAVKTSTGFVGVYKTQRIHELLGDDGEELGEPGEENDIPDARLRGHKQGGFALDWSRCKAGYVASGGDDGLVHVWDVNHRLAGAPEGCAPDMTSMDVQPLLRLSQHSDHVTGVSWHPTQSHLLVSSSMDGTFAVWDTRTGHCDLTWDGAHRHGVLSAEFSQIGSYMIASSGGDGVVSMWDIRRASVELYSVCYHASAAKGVRWSPFSETVFASYGNDRRVVMWDLARLSLGESYSAGSAAQSELSFLHAGHSHSVTDFVWSSANGADWLAASTDKGNNLQIYRPQKDIVMDYLPPDDYVVDEYVERGYRP